MAAINQDLQVFAGEDNVIPFTIYVPGSNNTQAQDITGWSLRLTVTHIQSGATPVTKTSPAGGIAITDPTHGKGTITLAQADLTTLQYASVWLYRHERIDAGLDQWLTYGKLTILGRS
jgi:hypothetical protein